MRGWIRNAGRGARRLVLLGAMVAVGSLAACGDDDDCNHVINNVLSANECLVIATERGCSEEFVYSVFNQRCKVQKCSDCNGGQPTPTETPVETPAPEA